jgi:hypothetical protein
MRSLIALMFLMPMFLIGTEWSSADSKMTFSLEPDKLQVSEKAVLTIETPGSLVDVEKLRKILLDPLNVFTEKLEIFNVIQEKSTLTLHLVPLVAEVIPLHLEKVPLTDGKMIAGEIMQLKVKMPPISIHNLAIMAAKPFPLDRHPIVDLSADNRYRYVNGEKALEKEKNLQEKMFQTKRFPLAKFIYSVFAILFFAACYHYRNGIANWLRSKLIPPYDPQRQAKRSISSALRLYGKDARFFVSVSDILRRYFGEMLAMDVEDLTTQELVAKFDKDPQISKEALNGLSGILQQSDLIKFAGVAPTEETLQKVSSQAIELISEISAKQDEKPQT